MADLIDRQVLLKIPDSEWEAIGIDITLLKQPAVDAVEVVRCKDCKYYLFPQGFCKHDRYDYQTMSVWQYGYDFCSYGERSADEEA